MTLTRSRLSTFSTVLLVGLLASMFAAFTPSAHATSTIASGSLIRGQSFSAVYYMGADGFRYVFPNDKAYFTWYSNFDTVQFITDAQLAAIQIGGNVTYKPGIKMVKINTDPKTYAVSNGGVLRHVSSEAIAISLYGSTWNKQIDDVADGFFSNYTIGDSITSASEFVPATVTAAAVNINTDKGLIAPKDIAITSSGFSLTSVTLHVGQTLRFTNNDTEKHAVTADDLTWGSGTMTTGVTFTRKFSTAGTYTYFDSYNSQFTGTIIVE